MRPTLAAASKAMRLPLHSKRANKDFYKGTRTGNIMVRKRIAVANRFSGEPLEDDLGRVRSWNLKTNRIDESRVASYVVPPGLHDARLQPLVFLGTQEEGGVVAKPPPGYPGEQPSRPGAGLDGRMYERLVDRIRARRSEADGLPQQPASSRQ